MRFHVLGIPHTISTPEYSSCAFTQKVVKLCAMLKMEGHTVIHYGHEHSKVTCDEHVAVVSNADLLASYPKHNWRRQGFPNFKKTDQCYTAFYVNTQLSIRARKQPGDMLLCSFGDWHKQIADANPDLIAIESGIGYPNGTFAKYKVYESYAIMHAYQGNRSAISSRNDFWYDAVIPNAFNEDEFDFNRQTPLDYFLFLGRLSSAKGLHIAQQIAHETKTTLLCAGQGEFEANTEYVKFLGVVGPKRRAKLLSQAKATICASTFLEPFCGVQIESFLSGTPVISSDWGAFAEYNQHGKTGYRCKTFEQFLWAARNIDNINRRSCADWGRNFTLRAVAPRYTDYFKSVADVSNGKGWYEPRDDRKSLRNSSFS